MRRPSDEAIRIKRRLFAPPFGRSPDVPPADPLTRTPMRVRIDQIEPYDRNPRHAANPAYSDIKFSIAQFGLLEPLVITRRPGSPRYTLRNSGNTRLHILRELIAAGRDDLDPVDCLFEPWAAESGAEGSEADRVVAHLITNDHRGELVFIDRARAIRDVRRLMEAERGRPLSQRDLVDALAQRGYRLNKARLSPMDYALDALLPLLPIALEAGLGRPQIERVRKLETAIGRVGALTARLRNR